ncbi:hypothetical protein SH2C18_09750 [Clostridium sediminicola]|uniref:hypothetical protein n=1 Tax=Clostridium sediminicola TaxID=3114879 RepID=UPI0031F22EAC
MGKLFKLELKNTYRIYGPFLLAVLIANIAAFVGFGYDKIVFRVLVTVLTSMAMVIAFLIMIIDFYKKDINEDRAYLTFTLPVTGKQILFVKTIIALMWTLLSAIVCTVFILLMIRDIGIFEGGINIFEEIIDINYTFLIIEFIIQYVSQILLIYFVITLLSSNKIKGKIGGFIGVIIFFVLSGIISFIETFILKIFNKGISSNYGFGMHVENSTMDISTLDLPFNDISYFTTEVIFTSIIIIILFLVTSYILDKKLEV